MGTINTSGIPQTSFSVLFDSGFAVQHDLSEAQNLSRPTVFCGRSFFYFFLLFLCDCQTCGISHQLFSFLSGFALIARPIRPNHFSVFCTFVFTVAVENFSVCAFFFDYAAFALVANQASTKALPTLLFFCQVLPMNPIVRLLCSSS